MVIDGFFDEMTANHIRALGVGKYERARVIKGAQTGVKDERRTNTQAEVNQWEDTLARSLVEKLSDIVRLPPENSEPAKLLNYKSGEKFAPHSDGFSLSYGQIDPMMQGGQRLFTTLCYLNDVVDGGETVFPALKIAVRPKLGRVLLFANTVPGTNDVHPHSVHEGRPALEGHEKSVLSVWWREHLFHIPRSYPEAEGALKTV